MATVTDLYIKSAGTEFNAGVLRGFKAAMQELGYSPDVVIGLLKQAQVGQPPPITPKTDVQRALDQQDRNQRMLATSYRDRVALSGGSLTPPKPPRWSIGTVAKTVAPYIGQNPLTAVPAMGIRLNNLRHRINNQTTPWTASPAQQVVSGAPLPVSSSQTTTEFERQQLGTMGSRWRNFLRGARVAGAGVAQLAGLEGTAQQLLGGGTSSELYDMNSPTYARVYGETAGYNSQLLPSLQRTPLTQVSGDGGPRLVTAPNGRARMLTGYRQNPLTKAMEPLYQDWAMAANGSYRPTQTNSMASMFQGWANLWKQKRQELAAQLAGNG